jgi:hypothetical protein
MEGGHEEGPFGVGDVAGYLRIVADCAPNRIEFLRHFSESARNTAGISLSLEKTTTCVWRAASIPVTVDRRENVRCRGTAR